VISIPKTDEQNKERDKLWREQATRQYLVRFMHTTGVPAAIDKAAKAKNETPVMYIKKAVVERLKKDGYLTKRVVLNSNDEKHMIKLAKEGRK